MASNKKLYSLLSFILLLFSFLLQCHSGKRELQLNYYAGSCPKAEEIIKQQLGGPRIEMKTGRKDSTESYDFIPNHNDSMSLVLSRFQSIGIDTEGTVALLGVYSHCVSLVHRLHPKVDPTVDPDFAKYLKGPCPSPNPDPNVVLYSRNDRERPTILDNFYHNNVLKQKGPLIVDQQLASEPLTAPFIENMAADNGYFHEQFSRAVLLMSENNPLTTPSLATKAKSERIADLLINNVF